MPDILIRMEMPRTCVDCHDADLPTAIAWLGAKCPWAHGIIDPGVYDLRHGRHPDCPLVELPPRGDLIDRDALKHKFCTHCDGYEHDTGACVDGDQDCMDARLIMNAPVVVPAERRDADA